MSTAWETVIGLEVHAQLRTATKLFGPAPTAYGAPPNSQVDPVSLGLPGALPVLNAEAVRMAALAGLATRCTVHERSVFARKNYFYADLPKGYQISQFDRPICTAGHLDIAVDGASKRVGITRIHLEEDAGKSSHGPGGSLVDLNRAGVPLIEIVSEPDLRSAEEAVAYLRELRAILVYIGVNDGNLEEGSFRCDANVSVRQVGSDVLGTRCEIKNLNSFRAIRDAIVYEAARQVRVVESGQPLVQQTRLWDTDKARTAAMRSKEEAHDYRYFPDPDLPPLVIAPETLATWSAQLPELPAARRSRYRDQLGLDEDTLWHLCEEPERAERFERALGTETKPERARSLASFLFARVAGVLNKSDHTWADVDAGLDALAEVHDQWRAGKLSNKMLSTLLVQAFATHDDEAADPGTPAPFVAALSTARAAVGVLEVDAGALDAAVDAVIAAHPSQAAAFRGGKPQLLGFFIGQVMREMKGKADAKAVSALLRERLSSS